MTDLFASPKRCVAYAKERIEEFERQVAAHFNQDGYTHVVAPDPNGIQEVHKLVLTSPKFLENVAMDILTNLRAALDQSGFDAARASGTLKAPRNQSGGWRKAKTSFPFGPTMADAQNEVARNGRELPHDIQSLFMEFKPYHGGNEPLWTLNQLVNDKKHRTLVPFGMPLKRLSFHQATLPGRSSLGPNLDEIPGISEFSGRSRRRNNEIILGRFEPGLAPKYDYEVSAIIEFDYPPIHGKRANKVLWEIAKEIENAVTATEAKCVNLGWLPRRAARLLY